MSFRDGGSAANAEDSAPVPGSSAKFGVEGGINLANLNGQNVNDVIASRLGFVGGAFLSLPLGTSLAIQPELLYEQKGGKFNGNPYQTDYVEVPILLDVAVLGPLGILLGPSFDANVASQGVIDVNPTDVGLILGAQLSFSKFILSGRYEWGLTERESRPKHPKRDLHLFSWSFIHLGFFAPDRTRVLEGLLSLPRGPGVRKRVLKWKEV